MSGRHTGPINLRSDAEWAAHVAVTRRWFITVAITALLFVGVLTAIILHKTGVI